MARWGNYTHMHRRASVFLLLTFCAACGGGNRQNSALCGITMIASANRVLDQVPNTYALLSEPPEALTAGYVPTRVVGFATARSMATSDGEGPLTLGYDGEGLPAEPGFGVAIVDDSSEVFRGVLIFETNPPEGYPELGVVAQGENSVPLFGLRIHWSSVNSEDCPIFAAPDSSQ